MREILKFGLLLGLVCAISAGTLTAVYSKVSVIIEENNRLAAILKRKTVLPEAETFRELKKDERTVYVGLDKEGVPVGSAMTLSKRGYAGPIKMTAGFVGTGDEMRLSRLAISKLDQQETPGLGVKITLPAFLDMFEGKRRADVRLRTVGEKKQGIEGIDSITAATISSRAVVEGVVEGMKWFAATFPDGPEVPKDEVEKTSEAPEPADTAGAGEVE